MRWDNLFDDLEGQLEQVISAEDVDLRAEEERLRLGRLSLRDRILSVHNARGDDSEQTIRLFLANGDQVVVRPATFGRDWFSGDIVDETSRRQQCVVPIDAIAGVALTRIQMTQSLNASPDESNRNSLSARLSLAFVLRDLCRRRTAVDLRTPTGSLFGTIDRVGRDHVDLAMHDQGVPRRESEVVQSRVVPLSQLLLVRI
jgi:hypothetical protein